MELQGSLQMTAGSITLDGYLLLLFAIMLFTGLLGGLANYFLSVRAPGIAARELLRYIVLGMVAALTVPLFLNMISSDLLAMARTRPIDLFVFAGFCLLFVLASRRLVDNLATRLRPPAR
ncbi:MAG: YEATS-associated helix-containing protein [Burkholderiales bacterium]